MNRECGILLPVFSIPSEFGIGCFSKEAYEFVDFLEASGQGYWQVLPIGPTGFGDSPYQPFSAFAGNPYFVSPQRLIEDGLLTWDEARSFDFGHDQERVDYGALYQGRNDLLKIAYGRFLAAGKEEKEFKEFCEKQAYWLDDYALFMTIKQLMDSKSWMDWDEEYKTRKRAALTAVRKENAEQFDFFRFVQYEFQKQWEGLHEYAAKKQVKVIGDLPFYVSLDSADVWAHPEVFRMQKDLVPEVVAGCPPDAFSATGQLWGNPVYDWKALKKAGYGWWVDRIRRNCEFFDVIRIDHFHGFAAYYAVPYGAENAAAGTHEKGPGMDLFRALKKELGEVSIIAEDLGTNTPENEKLLAESGFPGMKVLQYAFTSWNSYYVNHRHTKNSVVYTGTHDNTTLRAWVEEIQNDQRDFCRRYINSMNSDYGALTWDLIREAYRSVADLCIIPLQDYLVLGKEARINSPGMPDGNWQWRLRPHFLSQDLSRSIRDLAALYDRLPKAE